MRRSLVISALIASVGGAYADVVQKTDITPENIDTCEKWGGFAGLAMEAHQDGRPLADQMKLSPDPRAYDLTLEAYRTDRFISADQKKRAAAAYRDQITAECITSLSNRIESDSGRPSSFWAIGKH